MNLAQNKLDRFSREPGRVSNREIKRLVASVVYCLNLVALQYLTPCVLLIFLVCLYKSLSGLTWLSVAPDAIQASQSTIGSPSMEPFSLSTILGSRFSSDPTELIKSTDPPAPGVADSLLQKLGEQTRSADTSTALLDTLFTWLDGLAAIRQTFTGVVGELSARGVFVCRGVLGFAVFWCLAAWQIISLIGLAYYRFILD
ncbi:unnamed protein product [Protopolystoma xenopodis]|uniref:Uncharacterized protein n=1 Tax=Protopolystoma xenopodis TaxID=117903 RepID=A0A448XEN6_9PLAT|nr:unnamed protein product [Protopolystoma xenopodis]